MSVIHLLLLSLVLSSCAKAQPDYAPIGDGLRSIGICLVCYGVVMVLGSLVKGDKP